MKRSPSTVLFLLLTAAVTGAPKCETARLQGNVYLPSDGSPTPPADVICSLVRLEYGTTKIVSGKSTFERGPARITVGGAYNAANRSCSLNGEWAAGEWTVIATFDEKYRPSPDAPEQPTWNPPPAVPLNDRQTVVLGKGMTVRQDFRLGPKITRPDIRLPDAP